MTEVERLPEWASPEKWGNINTSSVHGFNLPMPRPNKLPLRVHEAAAYILETSLEEVLAGNYEDESAANWGGFDPDKADIDDGALVLLERESLTHASLINPYSDMPDAGYPFIDLPDDADQFVENWRNGTEKSFYAGSEWSYRSLTRSTRLSYNRNLQWGILVSSGRNRRVIAWSLNHIDVADGIVTVDDVREGTKVHKVPIQLGKTEGNSSEVDSTFHRRAIAKTSSIRLVRTDAAAGYKDALRRTNPLAKAAMQLRPEDSFAAGRASEIFIAGWL